jgi:hypothetical protein
MSNSLNTNQSENQNNKGQSISEARFRQVVQAYSASIDHSVIGTSGSSARTAKGIATRLNKQSNSV